LQSSQSIYHRNSYSRKSQKHYFDRSRLLRDNVSSQLFINRAKYIDYDYYNTDYKVRYYMPFRSTRKLAGSFKNSISTLNRLINRENILLGLPAEIPEQFKSRFSHTESREIPISSDSDRKSFSQNRLQSSFTNTGNNGSIIAAPKFILSFSGIFSISHFIKTGVTNFFINYKNMCEDYNIKKKKRIRRCPRYCAKYIFIIIRKLASFLEPN
jgi:hypothetical protein